MQLKCIDGCTLLKNLNSRRIDLPVIVITASRETKYRDCGKEYGAFAYLHKQLNAGIDRLNRI